MAKKKAKRPAAKPANGKQIQPAPVVGQIKTVPIDRIGPSPFQRRQVFDEAKLLELAASIEVSGLAHPPVVRPTPGTAADKSRAFELVVGERRWRACQAAGLSKIPVDVRDLDDAAARALVVAENLSREDLYAMPLDGGKLSGANRSLFLKAVWLSQTSASERWIVDALEGVAAVKPRNPWGYLHTCLAQGFLEICDPGITRDDFDKNPELRARARSEFARALAQIDTGPADELIALRRAVGPAK